MGRIYFISHEQLDEWMSAGSAEVRGDLFVLRLDRQYFARMQPAVFFTRIVSSPNDRRGLEGRVFDMEAVAGMGVKYSNGSAVIGDDAYDVAEGFLLKETQPMQVRREQSVSGGTQPEPALSGGDKSEIELLSSLILTRMREDNKE